MCPQAMDVRFQLTTAHSGPEGGTSVRLCEKMTDRDGEDLVEIVSLQHVCRPHHVSALRGQNQYQQVGKEFRGRAIGM